MKRSMISKLGVPCSIGTNGSFLEEQNASVSAG